jgi:Flp pilus assembly protein TadD
MRRHRLILPLCLALSGAVSLACAGAGNTPSPNVDFQKPEELPETAPVKVKPLTFQEEIDLADKLRNAGQQPEAAWHYVRGMQLNEENPLPQQRLAYMQLTRDVDRAERIFGDLVAKHPDLTSGYLGLGLAEIATGKPDSARAALEKVLEMDPDSAMAHMGLGMLDDKIGEHDAARIHYEKAHKSAPSRYEIQNNLGMSYLIHGDFEQAEESFREAIFLEPRDPALYNNLAVALTLQGEYSVALENFRKYANEGDALNNIGYACVMNGEFERAVRYFERSLLAGPSNRTAVLVNLRAAENALLEN